MRHVPWPWSSFYENLARAKSPEQLLDEVIKVSREDTVSDQWQFQILARILSKFKVILVSDMCDPRIIKKMHMEHAYSLQEAIIKAIKIKGENASITVIPDGVSVIVKQ